MNSEEKRLSRIEEQLKNLPDCPGVYMHRDSLGQVIYVGKAISLRYRVRQYFRSYKAMDQKTRALSSQIEDIDYITCGSEMEALVLECNLIKRYSPKYNILLRDDKTYPYIKVTLKEDYPRVIKTRETKEDGSKYFGPYTDAGAVTKIVQVLSGIYMLKHCSSQSFPPGFKPCLNHHIKLCQGPCMGGVSKEAYNERIKSVMDFLSGKDKSLPTTLREEMEKASLDLDFERAAYLRDSIAAIEALGEKQRVVISPSKTVDLILVAKGSKAWHAVVFPLVGGKLSGRETFLLDYHDHDGAGPVLGGHNQEIPGPGLEGHDQEIPGPSLEGEMLSAFIKQYYSQYSNIPVEIWVETLPQEKALIEEYLASLRGSKVQIKIPLRGEGKAIMNLARQDVEEMRLRIDKRDGQKKENERLLSQELKAIVEAWALGRPVEFPEGFRVEAYDISNTNGLDTVGAMVVFRGTAPLRKDYRRFKVRTDSRGDDYGALQEVVYRRLKRALELDPGFSTLPQAMFIDGGKGQVSAVCKVVAAMGFDQTIPVFGMAKDDSHRTRALIWQAGSEGDFHELPLKEKPLLFKYVGRIQEEVHRFAIDYHRGLRAKGLQGSVLDKVPGVGPKKRNALLKAFGSIEAIGNAEIEELCKVQGISKALAEKIKEVLSNVKS